MSRTRTLLAAVALCLAWGLPAAAHASDPAEPVAEADDGHMLSITVSPIHLFMPVVEITGEYRLSPKLGVAGILGGGQYTQETKAGDTVIAEDTFTVFEAGAQVRYYVFGDFEHGMQIGAELIYMHLAGDNLQDTNVSGSGAGLAVGPFIGYKIATDLGFTFDAQLGYEFVAVQAEASDSDTGESGSDSDSQGIPLLNLNVGWSF